MERTILLDKWRVTLTITFFWVGSVVNNVVYSLENMQCDLNNNLPHVLIINLSFDFFTILLIHQNNNDMHELLVSCVELQSIWPHRDLKRFKNNFYVWDSEQVNITEREHTYNTNNKKDPKNSLDIGGQRYVQCMCNSHHLGSMLKNIGKINKTNKYNGFFRHMHLRLIFFVFLIIKRITPYLI